MSDYRLFETDEFRRRGAALARHGVRGLDRKLAAYVYPPLREEPHHGPSIKRLQGCRPPAWRYRIGRFRVFFAIDEEERIVFLLTVDDRKDAYR